MLARRFSTDAQVSGWVSDITYVPTREGWLYLAVIIALHARRVLGYSLADHLPDGLVLGALGVDTHLDQHVAVLIDSFGRVVGSRSIATNAAGYEDLLAWASSIGQLTRAGVEGTGTYGAALARMLDSRGVEVLEVNRPNRSVRRLRGKSDPTDAENAARAVLNGEAKAIPKSQSGVVEALRAICMARRSAVKAKTQAINQMRALLVTAPAGIREKLWETKPEKCAARCARLRPLGNSPFLPR